MRMYIKSIEERAWQRVLNGWSPPRTVDDDGDSRVKPESSWSNDEVQTSNFNSKALNAIFTFVDVNMFSLITNCISAKEAWDILQKHCEWSESVRRTKLKMLTSKFESLRMEENETIVEYDRRLRDIANEAFSLGDPMSNERLDLISSLRIFEMNLDLHKRNKGKAVALQTTDDSMNSLIQEANESDLGEESISLITKKFGDYLKRMRDEKRTVLTPKPSFYPFERNKIFGHYANECANRLCRNTNMTSSLSDKDTDEEGDSEEGDNYLDKIQGSDQEELTVEIVQIMYEELYDDWLKHNETNSILTKENIDLKSNLSRLEVLLSRKDLELCKVKDDLEKATKTLAKFNSSSSKLDSMLTMGRDRSAWYFDSGCLRHMTGTKKHLTDYVEVKSGRVTYGGGAKRRIVGKENLNVDGLPELHNVLQLTIATNWEKVMTVVVKVSDLDLWHKKLGHVSFKTLNLCKFDAVRVSFLREKSDIFDAFKKLHARITNLFDMRVVKIRTDHGKEFENSHFTSLCEKKGISHEFSAPKTPQQNGIAEWKNRTLQEMDQVMLSSKNLIGKTKEDDTKGLLDTSEPLTSTGVEPGIESSETTPRTTPPLNQTEGKENEDVDDDVIINSEKDIPSKIQKNHPSSQIIGEVHEDVQTRKKKKVDYRKMIGLVCMSSTFSQARLVAQGYTQVEGVDFDETFAHVARIESFQLLLAVACHMRIKLYQMDVKGAFLNGILNDEAYVSQSKGFEYPHHMNHVYKLKKALYGLKQAPRTWYGRLAKYLINLGFKRGEVDKTFFIQKLKHDILICQVYIDDWKVIFMGSIIQFPIINAHTPSRNCPCGY
ncbi:uncharacterized protein [Primulina huaijiensis]|uniref:uncharacterized protein n=1 Tax=Primulina huaijiensis TaxID=1492673 RepID=UPI003CC70A86